MTRNTGHALEVVGASVLYAVALIASAWFLRNSDDLSQPVQVIVALVPIVLGVLMVWAYFRQISAMDEFMRKVQLDSLAIAAGGTAFLTLAYGSLEAAGFPRLSMFYVAPLMAAIWVTSNVIQALWHMRGASRT